MDYFIEEKIEIITAMIENNLWFVPVLAFLAGLLTSMTPCSLTGLTMIISYISGTKSCDKRRALILSMIFALGMAVVYTALGIAASLLGNLFHHLGIWWYLLLGAFMVLMALQMFGVIDIVPESFAHHRSSRKGFAGAFFTGMLGGFFASHCALPVLLVLLAMAAESGTVVRGAFMLLLFAMGHSVFVVIAGTSASILEKMAHDKKYDILVKMIKILIGTVMLILAAYLIYLGFYDLH
ncbi:MAG TPA: cytochrome c biogenesis protein CcdA [Bacillota bacterium]|nr:cytochrome c biogenesis protein CcdA [Bacillota bacterium]